MAWGVSTPGEDFASCSQLIERVRRNEITDLILLPGKRFESKDLIALAEIFTADKHNNKCRTIQASGHAVSEDALRIFGAALSSSCLEYLAIGDSTMGDEGIGALVGGIQQAGDRISSLKDLDLSFKGIGWNGLVKLGTVAEQLPSLTGLDLARNQLKSSSNNELAAFFPTVTNLNLSDCGLEIPALEMVVAHTKGCRELRLSNNEGLKDVVFQSIASLPLHMLAVSNCGVLYVPDISTLSIEILDVSENQLTHESIQAIRGCLPKLLDLNIASNPTLGVQGVTELASLENLTTLDASACDCGHDGALALIGQSKHLTCLRLFNNKLGVDGFQAIASLLRKREGQRFSTLDVAGNGADEGAVADLVEAAAPCVDCLVVGGNKSGPMVEEAIRKAKESYPDYDVARDIPKGSS